MPSSAGGPEEPWFITTSALSVVRTASREDSRAPRLLDLTNVLLDVGPDLIS